MNTRFKLFSHKQRDERISAQLGDIYKTGFYILALGILFDIYTRFNYLAQSQPSNVSGILGQSPLESTFLFVAIAVVVCMKARRKIVSDDLRYTEARSFLQTGRIGSAVALSALITSAAVGGRLYSEVTKLGWAHITWAGDIAMFVFMLGMFSCFFILAEYGIWRSYRNHEDCLAALDDED
ncbi:hypothetical protein [Atopobium fossor]|uniref:hypothetical protein n=1 Tax=Atopobium fossor TaxID=39487 RepID=UPI0003FE1B60|nr:hypothetical protein [Atopobium fossor]